MQYFKIIFNIWSVYDDIMFPDKTDVKILKVITENSRLSYRKIAKKNRSLYINCPFTNEKNGRKWSN